MKHKPFDEEKYRKKYKEIIPIKRYKTMKLEPKLEFHTFVSPDKFIQNLKDISVDIEIYVDEFMEKRNITDPNLVRICVKDSVDYKAFSRFEDVMLGYRDGNEVTYVELTMYELYKDEDDYVEHQRNLYLKQIEYNEVVKRKKQEKINKQYEVMTKMKEAMI